MNIRVAPFERPLRTSDQPVTTPTQARERIAATSEAARGPVSLADRMDTFERTVIARALADASGNVADAARRLQTDRPNLYRRMKRLGMGRDAGRGMRDAGGGRREGGSG